MFVTLRRVCITPIWIVKRHMTQTVTKLKDGIVLSTPVVSHSLLRMLLSGPQNVKGFRQLESFGDSLVYNLVLWALMNRYTFLSGLPHLNSIRSLLVSNETFKRWFKTLRLWDVAQFSSSGTTFKGSPSDFFEAYVGAMVLDPKIGYYRTLKWFEEVIVTLEESRVFEMARSKKFKAKEYEGPDICEVLRSASSSLKKVHYPTRGYTFIPNANKGATMAFLGPYTEKAVRDFFYQNQPSTALRSNADEVDGVDGGSETNAKAPLLPYCESSAKDENIHYRLLQMANVAAGLSLDLIHVGHIIVSVENNMASRVERHTEGAQDKLGKKPFEGKQQTVKSKRGQTTEELKLKTKTSKISTGQSKKSKQLQQIFSNDPEKKTDTLASSYDGRQGSTATSMADEKVIFYFPVSLLYSVQLIKLLY